MYAIYYMPTSWGGFGGQWGGIYGSPMGRVWGMQILLLVHVAPAHPLSTGSGN